VGPQRRHPEHAKLLGAIEDSIDGETI